MHTATLLNGKWLGAAGRLRNHLRQLMIRFAQPVGILSNVLKYYYSEGVINVNRYLLKVQSTICHHIHKRISDYISLGANKT